MIYEIMTATIKRGRYQKADYLKKLDVFLWADRITTEQYQDLIALMEEYPSMYE